MQTKSIFFLTGATGFVGAALARILIDKGFHLRLLARKGGDRRNLAGLSNIEIIEGDLLNPASYHSALSGCAGLFHVAADYRIWVRDEATMNRTNIEGTRALLMAAHRAGIPKIVYTSSVATLGNVKGGSADENTPVSLADMIGTYKRSKFLAEQMVKGLIATENLPCVIVNPSTPIGPRDIKPTPTGRIIVDAVKGKMPFYVDTGLNIAHVDDVALGHWQAFQNGLIGENYILGGENLPLGNILRIIAEITNKRPPFCKIPRFPLYPLALGGEIFGRLTRIEPIVTLDALRMARKKMYFSSEKAQKLLGYHSRPATQAIADAVRWFGANGYF